jgi:signal transduction histidine kinase
MAGVAAGTVVATIGGIPASATVRLVGYSILGAAIAGVAAAAGLHALRNARISVQTAVAGLAPLVAMAMGVAWASWRMFLTTHDMWVLATVLCTTAGISVVISMSLGRRVSSAARSVGDMARLLGEEGPGADLAGAIGEDGGRPRELAALAAELHAMSRRLSDANEQTAALERSRRELVAWVSHDLRTPLAGIRAMVEALEDGVVDDPESVSRYHRTIRQEADRLALLVDDLFELSRIHSGSLSLRFERVPLDEFVDDAVSSCAATARAKQIELHGNIRVPVPVIDLSTPEMARVVRNLLDNAIRHTPPGGRIVVDAGLDEADSSLALVSVQDGCGGIPEHDLDFVFDMAYRGDTARTPGAANGSGGFGLAVARGLVEAHDGQISVRNEGPGCRFVVRLPRHRPYMSATA